MNGFNLSNVSSVYVGSNSAGYVYLGSTKIWEASSGNAPRYTAPTAKSGLVYNGLAQALLNAGSTNDGTIQYSTDNTNWSTSIPTATNAGNNITVYWRLIGDASHNDVLATSITCVISKANFTTSVSIDGWFDNESANAPQVTNNLGNGNIIYRYKRAGEEDSTYTTAVPTIAGTYIIEATVQETSNYNSATATNNFFIHPADTCSIIYFADSMLAENTSANKGTGIGAKYAFYGINNSTINKVSHTFSNGIGILTFDNSIFYVYSAAFNSCVGLKHVVFPYTVVSIDKASIIDCLDLKSINIPCYVAYLNNLHNGYTDDNAMIATSINSVTSIIVENDNRKNLYFDSRNNCNAIIETATNTILRGCNYSFIPDGITSIGVRCFSSMRGLTSINIPYTVTSIGDYAFYDCSALTGVSIGSGITSIGSKCFDSCSALLGISFMSTIPPTILSNTFDNCNDCTLYVPSAYVNTYKNDSNWSKYASRIVGY